MQDGQALPMLAVRLALLIGVPALIALFLRLAGRGRGGAGRSISVGLIAGMILGPGLAGRIAPDLRGHIFAQSEIATAGVVASLGLALFVGGWAGRRPAHPGSPFGPRDLLSAFGTASISMAIVVLPIATLLGWLFDLDRASGLALGAAFGSGSAFARVTLRRIRPIGRSSEARLFLGCSLLLSLGVIAVLTPPERIVLLLTPAGAFAAGAVAARLAPLRARHRATLRGLLLLLMAGCAAHLASLIDPGALFSGWQTAAFILAVLLLGDDLAAIGAGLGWLTFGRVGSGVGSARRFMESQGLGTSLTMVALGVVVWSVGLVDSSIPVGAAVIFAFLLRGLVLEALLGAYRAVFDAATGEKADE